MNATRWWHWLLDRIRSDQARISDEAILSFCAVSVIKWRRIILISIGLGMLLSALSIARAKYVYEATLTLLPTNTGQDTKLSALSASLQSLPFASQLGQAMGETKADSLLSILQSRALAAVVLDKVDILPHVYPSRWDSESRQWKSSDWLGRPIKPPDLDRYAALFVARHLSVKKQKSGIVEVRIEFTDKKLVHAIAQAYPAALEQFLQEKTVSSAKRQRIQIENQIDEYNSAIAELEKSSLFFESPTAGISLPAATFHHLTLLSDLMRALSKLKLEYQITKSLSDPSLPLSPRLTQLSREIAEATSEVDRRIAQYKSPNGNSEHSIETSVSKIPLLYFEHLRLKENLQLTKQIAVTLKNQVELFRIQETREQPSFLLLDSPLPPAGHIRPIVTYQFIVGTLLSAILAVIGAIGYEISRNAWSRLQPDFRTALRKSQVRIQGG